MSDELHDVIDEVEVTEEMEAELAAMGEGDDSGEGDS